MPAGIAIKLRFNHSIRSERSEHATHSLYPSVLRVSAKSRHAFRMFGAYVVLIRGVKR